MLLTFLPWQTAYTRAEHARERYAYLHSHCWAFRALLSTARLASTVPSSRCELCSLLSPSSFQLCVHSLSSETKLSTGRTREI